jgi:hypothetical protein
MLLRLKTQWSIGGEHVKVSQCFKYLAWYTYSLQQRPGQSVAFRKQPSGGDLLGRACTVSCPGHLDVVANVDIAMHLYSAVVQPVLLFGCAVSSVGIAVQHCMQLTDPANNSNLAVEQVLM